MKAIDFLNASDEPEGRDSVRSKPKQNYDAEVFVKADEMGIPVDFALGVHRTEYNPRQWESPKGARGPMQLIPDTANRFNVDIDDPEQNISGGLQYLKFLLDRYKTPEECINGLSRW